MKYLTNIDMSQNELQNAVFQNLKQAPMNPKIGQIYTDMSGDTPKLVWWNGEEWVDISGGVTTPEVMPTIINPSVSISTENVDASNLEVGTTIPISYTAKFNPGSYSYGPDTGIQVVSWNIYDTNTPTNYSNQPTGTFAAVTVGDTTEYKLTAEATHSAGAIPVGDRGTPQPALQILAGKVEASTKSIAGYRKYFYGSTESLESIDSEMIRSLTHSDAPVSSGISFDMNITEGSNRAIVAFPENSGLSLSSVIDTGAFNIDIYDVFEEMIIPVEGANGYEAINYKVYVYAPAVSLSKNKYKVTIS